MDAKKILAISALLAIPAATSALAPHNNMSALNAFARGSQNTRYDYFTGMSGGWSATFDSAATVGLYLIEVGPEASLVGGLVTVG